MVALLVSMLALSACGGGGGAIKIAILAPLSGDVATFGQSTRDGVMLAVEEWNAKGGPAGYKIQYVLGDSQCDPKAAADAAKKAVDEDKVQFIIGAVCSSETIPIGEYAATKKVPLISGTSTNAKVTVDDAGHVKKYSFRACFIDPFQGRVMAQFAYDKLGARKAAIIQDIAQDYAVGLANFFRQAFVELTGDPKSVVAFTSYQTGDRDYTAQLTYVANAKPDVVFAPGYYADAAVLVTQARSLGLKMPFLGGDTFEAPEFIEIGGKNVEGVYFSTHYSADAPVTPASEKFVAQYKAKFKTAPNTFAALGYDCYNLILDAMERAGSSDPKAIRDAIAKTKGFVGATGIITLDANGDATKSAVVLVVKDGQFKLVDVVHPR